MLILVFVFALVHVLQGALTSPVPDLDKLDLDTSFLFESSLTFGTRSASEIIFSCLATIFACTWTAIHPNIPGPTDCGWTKLKGRVATTVDLALKQRLGAKRIADSYNNKFIKHLSDVRPFSQLVLDFVREWFNDRSLPLPIEEGEAQSWTITHGFFVLMGGFMLSEKGVPIQVLPYSKDIFEGKQGAVGIEDLIKEGVLYAPTTTEADIKDRSKGNTISKIVVLLQSTWFIMQCIARWSKGLTLTEIEVVTLGFAVLNGITYALWWDKPQSVGVPVYLEKKEIQELKGDRQIREPNIEFHRHGAHQPPEDEHKAIGHHDMDTVPLTVTAKLVPLKMHFLSRKLAKDQRHHSSFKFRIFDIPYRLIGALIHPLGKIMSDEVIAEGALRVPMFYSAGTEESKQIIIFSTSSLIAVIFGSVHLIPAWFLHFASSTEMFLWRVSAIVSTVEPIVIASTGWLFGLFEESILDSVQTTIYILFLSAFPLYILCRVILIMIAFTSLRALPSDAHLTIDWISFIPHF